MSVNVLLHSVVVSVLVCLPLTPVLPCSFFCEPHANDEGFFISGFFFKKKKVLRFYFQFPFLFLSCRFQKS